MLLGKEGERTTNIIIIQSKKKPVQQRDKHKVKKAHEVKVNDSEEGDFDALVTDEDTVKMYHLPV